MGYIIPLSIAGFLKLFSGVDLISFIFLYALIFDDDFDYYDLLSCLFFAELFSIYSLGLFIMPYFLLYIFRVWQLKVFQGNRVFNFLFLILGFIFIRGSFNLYFFIEYKADMAGYLLSLLYSVIFITVIYFIQLYLEKCFPKYIRRS
jgi:hypothetical protein